MPVCEKVVRTHYGIELMELAGAIAELVSLRPRVVQAAIAAIATRASSSAYSTVVSPSSSLQALLRRAFTSGSLSVWIGRWCLMGGRSPR